MLRYALILCAVLFTSPAFAQDTCDFANDNECDETRYGGQGYCDDGTDTTDCTLLSQGIKDDSCTFANDAECDEYRYNGTGACQDGSDTSDCTAWQAQRESDFMDRARALDLDGGTIAGLGNNTCRWSNDGECDDVSLGGTGACDPGTDATDCLALIDNSSTAGIPSGDNSCLYANDNECDETRFGGSGYCEDGTDANDCSANFTALPTGGDNSCSYANDNECDEARFGGGGYCDDGTDTNDCSANTANISPAAGPDSCEYANDNECDEARYGGGNYCDVGTDTTDCRLLAANMADDSCQTATNGQCDELRFGGTGICVDGSDTSDCGASSGPTTSLESLLALVPADLRAQLGDDSCEYANDLECDDEDFGGTGACEEGTDASDCRALALGGDNSCQWANDNECDEPIGTNICISGSDTNDCHAERAFIDRSDTCNSAFDGICNEANGGDGTCTALTDTADCIGRSRPASLDNHFFGRDDRLLVNNTQMPWRTIGSIDQSCTGTLVGPALVLTAAHCLYDGNGTFSTPEIFYAGQSRGENLGVAKVESAFHDPGYDNDGDFAPDGGGNGVDWALLVLSQPLGNEVGYLEVHPLSTTELSQIGRSGLLVNQAGYSWDTGDNMSGNIGCRIVAAFDDNSVNHECDTAQGDSGSPFLLQIDGEWKIIAVDSHFFNPEDSKAPFSVGNRAVDSRAFAAAVTANQ